MLTVIATLPLELGGLGTRVIYIDTEATFSSERCIIYGEGEGVALIDR